VENDLDTTGWHGGAEKIAKKGASRRPKAYTRGLGNIIPDIGGVMSDEERRNCFVSTAEGGQPHVEL
jgi:hypothetical protein